MTVSPGFRVDRSTLVDHTSASLWAQVEFPAGSNVPMPGHFEERDDHYYVGDRRNTMCLPPYARLDLRASRAFDFTRRRLTLFVEVINVLNRTNDGPAVGSVRRPSNEAVGYTRDLLPMIPSAGILIEF